MLPSEVAILLITVANLVVAIRVTRKAGRNAGYMIPLILCLMSKIAYASLVIADFTLDAALLLPDVRDIWSLTIRLQAGLSAFSLLLNYSSALNESEAYRKIKMFFYGLDRSR